MSDTTTTKPKKPATVIGTAGKINKLLQEHTVEDRKRILVFLSENG